MNIPKLAFVGSLADFAPCIIARGKAGAVAVRANSGWLPVAPSSCVQSNEGKSSFVGIALKHKICEKWSKHRESGKNHDSFKCYQKLEDDIAFIQANGVDEFEQLQKTREKLLKEMLRDFNEGRSKRYYCIAATVFEVDELQQLLNEGAERSKGLELKEKSKVLRSLLDSAAEKKGYLLKLRK